MRVAVSGLRPVREIENLWIPMPDGVRLAARVWLPEDAERHPVPAIVEYIPYRKRDGTAYRDGIMQPYIAGHGYAVLRIDVRGTGDSEGLITDEYTRQEHDDALAAFEWIVAQRWCSGGIGMLGVSWGGFNSLQVAARHPPALKAIVTICAADDRYSDDAHYMGGCMLNENIVWGAAIFAQAALPPDPLIVGERWREMWLERLRHSPLWAPRWLEHQRRDEYWKYGSVSESYEAIRCPVYAIGGWADAYRNAVPRLLANLHVPSKGLIGPWCHGWPIFGEPGAPIGLLQELLRWWDRWLKDAETGIMDEPRYRVWMQDPVLRTADREEQPGRWVAEEGWPSPRITPRRLWLARDRLDTRACGEEALTHSSVQYTGGASGAWCPYGGDLDTDQHDDDGHSLVFDSGPLAEGFEILGAPVVELDVAVDRPCALIAVRLCDVDEGGASARVSYGLLNLTHRESHEHPTPLEPGRRYRVRVALDDIAYAFPAGHRVRLALSTSYWPTAWPSPEPVRLTVYTGASTLDLPERPPRAEDSALASFGEPEGAPEPAMTTLVEGRGRRVSTHDPLTDRMESIAGHHSGMERFDAIGLAVGVSVEERYAIVGDDPLTAEGSLAWIIRRERGSWRVRVEAAMKLKCTARSFVLDQSLAAFEGDEEICAQSWHREIPRDLA
jgi:putative CocE/NonD family hydrolase